MAKHDETRNGLLNVNNEVQDSELDRKIRVTKAEIVVSGSVLKPLFCIHYREVG